MIKESIEAVRNKILYNVMNNKLDKIMKQEAKRGKLYCSFYYPDDVRYDEVFTNLLRPKVEKEYTVHYLRKHVTEEAQVYKVYRVLWCKPKGE